MISVLIPVYATDVRELVKDLSQQSLTLAVPCEILLLDDGSPPDIILLNKEICSLPNVSCYLNQINTGRTAVRHALSAKAKYSWLLFIDGDSGIPDKDFLSRYATVTSGQYQVITGGRNYPLRAQIDCHHVLHWKYGIKRENRWRTANNIKGFQTNNFLIKKELFHTLSFRMPPINGYGHEDTRMGVELERLQASILHIQNPVLHLQLETNETFIQKAHDALKNLHQLSENITGKQLAAHVKLFNWYRNLRMTRLLLPFQFLYKVFERTIDRNLASCHPSLLLFDLHRLDYFIKISR